MVIEARLTGGIGYILLLIYELALIAITVAAPLTLSLIKSQTQAPYNLGPTIFTFIMASALVGIIMIIGLILIGIGWILLGRYIRSRTVIATGILILLLTIISVVSKSLTYALKYLQGYGYTASLTLQYGTGYNQEVLSAIIGLAIAILIIALVLATIILHIKSHFIAASKTGVSLFKIAGVVHAVAFALFIVIIISYLIYAFAIITSEGGGDMGVLGLALLGGFVVDVILYIVGTLLSALAFLSLKPRYYSRYY